MAGRKIRFDPVAKSDQRSTWTCKGGRYAWPQRHRPIVAKCLLPDQCHVSVRRAGNFDLIQRYAGWRESGGRPLRFPLRGRQRGITQSLTAGEVRAGTDAGLIKYANSFVVASAKRRSVLRDFNRRGTRTPESSNAMWNEPLPWHRINQLALERAPMDVRKFRPAILRFEWDTSPGASLLLRKRQPCRRACSV